MQGRELVIVNTADTAEDAPLGRLCRDYHELLRPLIWPQACETENRTSTGCLTAEWTGW